MHYAHYGFRDFYFALGYKGEYINKHVVDLASLHSDLRVNLRTEDIRRDACLQPVNLSLAQVSDPAAWRSTTVRTPRRECRGIHALVHGA